MVKRSFSLIMAIVLIGCLAFSALAVDVTSYDFSDSGVQVFAAPQSVAAASLAAAADTASATAGEYGYIPNNFSASYHFLASDSSVTSRVEFVYYKGTYFPAGDYVFSAVLSQAPTAGFVWYSGTYPGSSVSVDGNKITWSFSVDDPFTVTSSIGFFATYPLSVDSSAITYKSYSATYYTPVDGISSGFTYSSGAISDRDHQDYDTVSASFGDQPAGDYLINIYHWGQSYDVNFALLYNGRRLSASTDGGVTTAVVSHGGGDLTITGSFDIVRTTNWDTVGGSFFEGGGNIVTDAPGSWTFNISDIVAVPLTNSSVEQYGICGPIVGFFRDQYSSLKSFLSGQFQSIKDIFKGDETGKLDADITKGEELHEQEKQVTDAIIVGFDDASKNVDPSTITIPNDVLSGFVFMSDLFMLVFNGLGNYKALVMIPLCIGIAAIIIGRGFWAAAGYAPQRGNYRVRVNPYNQSYKGLPNPGNSGSLKG